MDGQSIIFRIGEVKLPTYVLSRLTGNRSRFGLTQSHCQDGFRLTGVLAGHIDPVFSGIGFSAWRNILPEQRAGLESRLHGVVFPYRLRFSFRLPAGKSKGKLGIVQQVHTIILIGPHAVSHGFLLQNPMNMLQIVADLLFHDLSIAFIARRVVRIKKLVDIYVFSLIFLKKTIQNRLRHGHGLLITDPLALIGKAHGNTVHHRSVIRILAAIGSFMAVIIEIAGLICSQIRVQPHLHGQIGKYLLGFCQQPVQIIVIKPKKQFQRRAFF